MNREKSILMDYLDACELINETEEDIRKLRRCEAVHDKVTGSNPEFPYQPQNFNITGITEVHLDDAELKKEREILRQRKENAREVKIRAEEIINSASVRMQRIIRYRIFKHMTWEDVAVQMGGKSTADSLRMEFQRYLEEN